METSLNQRGNKYSYLEFTCVQVGGGRIGSLASPLVTTQLVFVFSGIWGVSGAEQLPTAGWGWWGMEAACYSIRPGTGEGVGKEGVL